MALLEHDNGTFANHQYYRIEDNIEEEYDNEINKRDASGMGQHDARFFVFSWYHEFTLVIKDLSRCAWMVRSMVAPCLCSNTCKFAS